MLAIPPQANPAKRPQRKRKQRQRQQQQQQHEEDDKEPAQGDVKLGGGGGGGGGGEGDGKEGKGGVGLGGDHGPLSRDPQVCLAVYIAMAHAGLAFSLALLYGLARLLQEYWRPIQWALLCSIPLRELHTALVGFWSHPLRLGLPETLLAVPLAALRSAAASLLDSHQALLHLLRLLRRRPSSDSDRRARTEAAAAAAPAAGFSKVMQWLVSFALFVLLHERLGALALPAFAASALPAFAAGAHRPPLVATALSAISSARHGRRRQRRRRSSAASFDAASASACASPPAPFLARLSRYLTSGLLARLNTLVAVSLIVTMISGAVAGFVFFSYKMGIEGKDAVIALNAHLQERNYSQWIGIQKWMDDHEIPELIESCTSKLYESIDQYVDSLAIQYNATEIVDGFRRYLIKPLESSNTSSMVGGRQARRHPFSGSMRHFLSKFRNREWKAIYAESDGMLREFLSVLVRDDLVEKIRRLTLQSIDVSKRVFASSTMVLAGSANIVLTVAVSIISSAAGLLNFASHLMVFLWLLYYLIASKSGGVMDHVLGMFPISKATRDRCAEVLDHAVSSVLLATAKVALFQGCFTYLLFRFYRIHFLYVSTFLAWTSAILPITPCWLSSIPAAAQLAVEARYLEAVVLTAIHLFVLDYGTFAIQDEIPGQNAYLAGLSILGGMALFPSVLEGAIMGPLLLTVMIAVKNLYAEFVLLSVKESSR